MYHGVVLVEDGPEPTTVRKRAITASDRLRLQHEAGVLRAAAHPGVVELLSVDGGGPPESLVLRRAAGGRLAEIEYRPPEVAAGIGAAVATTLADLHDIGFSHGAVRAEHVLLDGEGRPVLCGFGRATAGGWAPELVARQHEDVRNLAALVLEWAADGGRPVPRSLRSVLEAAAATRGRPRRYDARRLARALVECVPGARLPDGLIGEHGPVGTGPVGTGPVGTGPVGTGPVGTGPVGTGPVEAGPVEASPVEASPVEAGPVGAGPVADAVPVVGTSDPPTRPGRRRAWLLVLPAGALIATVLAITLTPHSPHRVAAGACPAVDDRCGPVALDHGVLVTPRGRYRMANATDDSDVTVLGRWDCGPGASPAVLRVSGGEVWVFDAWPATGTAETARLLARVPNAVGLRVEPGRSGCDRLRVLEGRGHSVVLDPRRV